MFKLIKKILSFVLYFIIGLISAVALGLNKLWRAIKKAYNKPEQKPITKPVIHTSAARVEFLDENGNKKVLYGDFVTNSDLNTASFVEWK